MFVNLLTGILLSQKECVISKIDERQTFHYHSTTWVYSLIGKTLVSKTSVPGSSPGGPAPITKLPLVGSFCYGRMDLKRLSRFSQNLIQPEQNL